MGRNRILALAYGACCHLAFAVGVGAMAAQLFLGMAAGPIQLPWPLALLWDVALVAQFAVLHSWLLTRRGAHKLRTLAPEDTGSTLDTTLYAAAASLQVFALFGLWAPIGDTVISASGTLAVFSIAGFAAGWLLLLRAMDEAGLGIQTGATGWIALLRGRRPRYPHGFPEYGLHSLCRHPIYAAFILLLWSGPHWSLDRLLLALPLTLYCIYGPQRKEARYLTRHGDAYADYMARTPALVPRLFAGNETIAAPVSHTTRSR